MLRFQENFFVRGGKNEELEARPPPPTGEGSVLLN